MLNLLYGNTLKDITKQLNMNLAAKVDTEKLIMMNAGKIAKTVGRKTWGAPQGGFPAMGKDAQGYFKFFRVKGG